MRFFSPISLASTLHVLDLNLVKTGYSPSFQVASVYIALHSALICYTRVTSRILSKRRVKIPWEKMVYG
jgi:hypothetical protein